MIPDDLDTDFTDLPESFRSGRRGVCSRCTGPYQQGDDVVVDRGGPDGWDMLAHAECGEIT